MNLKALLVSIVAICQGVDSAVAADEVIVEFQTEDHGTPGVWVAIQGTNAVSPQDPDSGQAFTITVPFTSGSPSIVRSVRIRTTSPDADNIGAVVITGERPSVEPLYVLVSSNTGFPVVADTTLAPAAKNWAGLKAVSTTTGDFTFLRKNVILAARVSGHIQGGSTDEIDVGQVFSLQVRTTETQTTGGNLMLPVKASTVDDFATGSLAIGYVDVENLISGDILAGSAANSTVCSIGTILVYKNGETPTDAEGITGRILAPNGSISQIVSCGEISISTLGTDPGIQAGTRIDYIYTGEPPTSQEAYPTVAKDISARIECYKLTGSGETQTLTGDLRRLRTAGDLTKPVRAVNIRPLGNHVTCGENYGIWVGGTITQPIDIEKALFIAIISANDFDTDAHVTVGHFVKGTIEARDIAGHLRAVTIGRGAAPLPFDHGLSGWAGVCGIDSNVDPPSIIRAKSVGAVEISRTYVIPDKVFPPRIEADSIGTLIIDEMVSGEVRGHSTGSDAYAVIGAALIGESYGGDSAFGDADPAIIRCESFDTFDVTADHGGDLQFKTIPAARAVRIGGAMASEGGSLGADYRAGRVLADTAQSLYGQVIINASGDPEPVVADACAGPVVIEDGTTDILLSAAASTDDLNTLPRYTRVSSTVGGGAVGLAPFYLYEVDCDPPHDDMTETIFTDEFDRKDSLRPARPIKVRFYGPVRTALATASPVNLYLVRYYNGAYLEALIPETRYSVTVKRGGESGFSREITLIGNGTWLFPSGWYEVRRKSASPPPLFCDLVEFDPQEAPLAVQSFEYGFYLSKVDSTVLLPTGECGCAADYNQDGGADGADLDSFFVQWEAAEGCSDVNRDGGVDGADVEAFFVLWEAGDPDC